MSVGRSNFILASRSTIIIASLNPDRELESEASCGGGGEFYINRIPTNLISNYRLSKLTDEMVS